ncbi:MAG TPA: hypothetical protein VGK99_04325 [Acidobacteriota bacterium]|jgi:hypothetical protein
MDLGVAIGTAAIYGPYVQRFSGGGLMARQHMNMALLAYQVNSVCEQLGIARSMGRVTVETVFANRRMFPEKGAAFFGMAGITKIIDRARHKHPSRLTPVGVVAGCTPNLHIPVLSAKQVGGALVERFSFVGMAGET